MLTKNALSSNFTTKNITISGKRFPCAASVLEELPFSQVVLCFLYEKKAFVTF